MRARAPDRRRMLALLGAGAVLAGCGFTPVHAPGEPGASLRGRIAPDAPPNREAFEFVGRIEDRFGQAGSGDLRLSYMLSLRQERLALTGTGGSLRFAVVGRASYRIHGAGGGILTRGEVAGSASYSDQGPLIGVRTARADARLRVSRILADNVAARLLATAPDWLP